MKKKKIRSLIFGISGQDGSYLSHFLISKGYDVCGTTRNNSKNNLKNLVRLGILKKVKIIKCNITDFIGVKKLIKIIKPDEIYYLCGKSSVTQSFTNPVDSFKSNTLGLLNILDTVKKTNKKIKVFNAVSGQFYGNKKSSVYNEKSYIDPQSPYGVSKASSFWLTKIFREWYGIKCCSGILFNHESPLRSNEFVTKKIINSSKLIKKGKLKHLYLGNINIYRDWGWAPEYVEAMYLMLRQKNPKDLVIGSGKRHSLRSFVYEVFRLLNISRSSLKINVKKLMRKRDIRTYKADPKLAKKILKWKAKTSFKQIIYKMVNEQLY
ncbi:MAG: GDP-mannose 4,6-dehydratase [Pelagibacteraceae bacterium]|nr:GDP-mannose 4,6-dehydratase [Pelagibacteraceae bacterium]